MFAPAASYLCTGGLTLSGSERMIMPVRRMRKKKVKQMIDGGK
jgi:hypothetical protein